MALAFLWLAEPFVAGALAHPEPPAAQTVVQRFQSRPDERLTCYRALRRLEARNDRFKKHGWLEAWTELTPDGRFIFEIVREGGSDYILKKVLRPFLEKEQRVFASGEGQGADVTFDNYELEGVEDGGPGLVKLLVKSRRRDVSLVDGAIYITARDADIVRLEGRLAKNPSFWTRRVDIVRQYGRLAGVRVPMRLDSVAQVRMVGSSTLTMTYEYHMVNGVRVRPSAVVATRP